MSSGLPYRDFYYPLNVFMHILTREEGSVPYLHYALFEREGESIAAAQERSTQWLVDRLPAPPARLLDVGAGVGTTLNRLETMGYEVVGITPDEKQVAFIRRLHGERAPVLCARYEEFDGGPFDVILFQESSQYIDSETLFARARAPRIIVLDEFATEPIDTPGALRSLSAFLEAAARHRFELVESVDVSDRAAPTIDYFVGRLPRYRDLLISDLGLTNEQVDDLIVSGRRYRQLYRDGVYVYRLMQLRLQ